jgi:rhodanese-related sulfurtransferase
MNDHLPEISTNELKEKLNSKNILLVDVRPVDAYNGWKLRDEPIVAISKAPKAFLKNG